MSTLPDLSPRPGVGVSAAGEFLIAGSGSIGRRHLANLRALGVSAFFYRTGRRDPAAPVPDAAQEFAIETALARRPRAVLVCNPNARHLEVALAAARAGAHLFVEKPLSHSLEGTAELLHEVRRRGLLAVIGFQYRFHPGLLRVKRWLDEGAIGEAVSARVHWGEYLPAWHPGEEWRASYAARRDLGGGAVRTLCHPFDYLRWLFGEPASVWAETSSRGLGLDVEDAAQVGLRFASGVLANVSLDYLQRPRAHGLEVVGRRGRIVWADEDGAAYLHSAESERVTPFLPPSGFSRNSVFLDEMRHFLACLDGRERPACTLEDGVAALEIALGALEAARLGRRVTLRAAR